MFGSLGFTELVLILMIVLIIFGAGKLPQLGEGIGKAIKGFKKSVNEVEAMDVEAQAQQAEAEPPPQASAPPQLSQSVAPQPASSTVQPSEAVSTSKG
ncbi:MAG: twin-arginine translocase TatA/TatE family subunit [Nitrospirales bacterium]